MGDRHQFMLQKNAIGSDFNIHCDATNCTFYRNIEWEDLERYQSQPCPLCGKILLTEADFKRLMDLEDALHRTPDDEIDATRQVLLEVYQKDPIGKYIMDGTGKLDIKAEEDFE